MITNRERAHRVQCLISLSPSVIIVIPLWGKVVVTFVMNIRKYLQNSVFTIHFLLRRKKTTYIYDMECSLSYKLKSKNRFDYSCRELIFLVKMGLVATKLGANDIVTTICIYQFVREVPHEPMRTEPVLIHR